MERPLTFKNEITLIFALGAVVAWVIPTGGIDCLSKLPTFILFDSLAKRSIDYGLWRSYFQIMTSVTILCLLVMTVKVRRAMGLPKLKNVIPFALAVMICGICFFWWFLGMEVNPSTTLRLTNPMVASKLGLSIQGAVNFFIILVLGTISISIPICLFFFKAISKENKE